MAPRLVQFWMRFPNGPTREALAQASRYVGDSADDWDCVTDNLELINFIRWSLTSVSLSAKQEILKTLDAIRYKCRNRAK